MSKKTKMAPLNKLHIKLANADEQQQLATLGFQPYTVMVKQAPPKPILPPRQQRCLTLLQQGKTVKSIANTMGITEHTVRRYLAALRKKFACHTNVALVKKTETLD